MILSSILPGVRQLRAPLAAGYLWILFIFLLAHLGSGEPHAALAKDLARLGDALSPAGLAVAVSFAAYLVGSFSQVFPRAYRVGSATSSASITRVGSAIAGSRDSKTC